MEPRSCISAVTALATAITLAAPARVGAQEPVPPGGQPNVIDYEQGDIAWQSIERMARERYRRAGVLVPLGAIAAGVGLALVGSEYTRGDTRSGPDSTLLASCGVQLQLGSFLTMEGLHLLVAGIAYAGRGYHLQQLARVRFVEGPSPMWARWSAEGKGLRVAGNVLLHLGAVTLSGGVSYLAPYPTCEELYCGDCAVSDKTLSSYRKAGIALTAVGGGLAALGAVLAAVGYARQFRMVKDRHAPATFQATVDFGPGGVRVTW